MMKQMVFIYYRSNTLCATALEYFSLCMMWLYVMFFYQLASLNFFIVITIVRTDSLLGP